ncbi:Cell cycle serine/threonine-protein kinase cdc5/MSD2 [Mortierella sp. AD010]|nr:Cell cycle serine/threonine-protein kinase cdc5/MSD2 [Mortierella sp. AD010]
MTSRYDAGPSANNRGLHMTNTNANTNTHTMMTTATNMHTQTGTTTTATTNQTGMTDKPKSRKKDKPPRIPPPDQIYDSTTKTTYIRGPALGEGGFASCYIISDQKKNRFAAKVIQKTDLPTYKTRQKLFAEIKIHQGLSHENIVKYYHCFEDDDFVYLVLEMCECKTLMELIKRRKRLTEPEVRYYMKEIVAACSYLHRSASVIHRDLKLGNIFLTHDMHVRIGDFGLATLIVKDERKKTICGTPNYIAPEILFDTDNGHSFEVDIWSIGVIMYTLLVGKPPFQTNEVKAIYKKIRDNNYVFPDDVPISDEAKSLVAALLTPTPGLRPSVEDVLSHPFFASGYCPKKLDKDSLQSTPKFEQEELREKELRNAQKQDEQGQEQVDPRLKPRSEHRQNSEGENAKEVNQQAKARTPLQQRQVQPNPPRQQLHYDQTSFGVGSPSEEPARRHSETKLEPVNQSQKHPNTPSGNRAPSQLDPARYTPSRPSPLSMQAQQTGSSTTPRLQYGEQFKMEMVEGDQIITEIRTVNVNRGRSTSNFPQYAQDNSRAHHDHQFKQRATAMASLTVDEASSVGLHQGNNTEPIQRRESIPSRPVTSFVQHPQASSTQPSISSRQDPRISASVPSLPSTNGAASSRLPVARSRLGGSGTSPQPSGFDQSSSASGRNGYTNPYSATSPRPPNSAIMGSSTPNLPTHQSSTIHSQYQQENENSQLHQLSSSPSTINRRRSADLVNAVGSTFGKSQLSRQQGPLSKANMRGPAIEESQLKRQHRGHYELNLMDVDTDMDVDHNAPQHLDVAMANMSDVMPSPARLSDNDEQMRKQQDSQEFWDSQQSRSSTTTIIQHVQGVERPASAMQRTFSQERELSEMNRALESPRKISRVFYSHSAEPLSASRGSAQANFSAGFTTHSQPQSQQHSFLQSSQHGSQTLQTARQQSSQSLQSQSQLRHLQSPRHMPSSPSLRMTPRSSHHWPTGATGPGSDGQGATHITTASLNARAEGALDEDDHADDIAQNSSPSQHSSQSNRSHKPSSSKSQQHIGLGLSGAEDSRVSGMVSATENDANPASRSHQNPSLQSQQSRNGSIDDPYRYQITSPTQLRAPRTKQAQALHQLQSQSPKGVSSSSFSSSQSFSRDQSRGSQGSQKQGDHSNNGESSFQNYRSKSRETGAGDNAELSTSEIEESSMDQSQTKEAFEAKRQMQFEMRRKMQRASQLKLTSQQDQDQLQEQGQRRVQYKQLDGPEGVGSSGMVNNNTNLTKQSNETTMAGMSSGGNSDEQDHVEVPSTSCVTTTSISMSMHREQPHHQKQQQQQQQQDQQQQQQQQPDRDKQVKHKSRSGRAQRQDTCGLEFLEEMRLDPVGYCEEVEKYLRNMIRVRKEGILMAPTMESTPPKPPKVFLTRWINYERYGVGWYLTNGVIGVMCNDKTTLAMSPNGVDLEIIEPPLKHRIDAKRNATKSRDRRRESMSNQDNQGNQGNEKAKSMTSSGYDFSSNNITAGASPTKKTFAQTMSDLKAVLELEKEEDADGDYQMMLIYDGENNVVKPKPMVNRSVGLVPSVSSMNGTSMDLIDGTTMIAKSSKSRRGRNRGRDEDEDDDDEFFAHYDRWDSAKFLSRLIKTNCRINRYPTRFEKKMKVLHGFKNYMEQMLSSRLSWGYEDTHLTHGMPFLTDWFRRQHVISRLSNGIVQVNFADHTKMVLSEYGQVLTFIDNDQNPRRITMTVHQALVPEYFYDVDDIEDQDTLIQTELDQIARQHMRPNRAQSRPLGSFIDKRPAFDPDVDYDLIIFPRPRLVKKETERLLQHSHNQYQLGSQPFEQDDTLVRQFSKLNPSSTHPLQTRRDATQVPLVDINKDDGPVKICSMTFMQLHHELVRRLRLVLKLLNERRLYMIEEHKKETLEREQLKRDREDNRRRRQERQAQKEKREKAKEEEEKEEGCQRQELLDRADMEVQQEQEQEQQFELHEGEEEEEQQHAELMEPCEQQQL